MNSKVAKELRALLKAVSKVDHEQGGLHADDLLSSCEKIAPSKHLGTGGSLFEMFIIIFGTERDSSTLVTNLQPRKRSKYKPKPQEIKKDIERMTKQYALR